MAFNVAGSRRMLIASNGDISFYEDTGTTPKLFWDSSAESLGIGTTTQSGKVTVDSSSNDGLNVSVGSNYLVIKSQRGNDGDHIRFFNGSGATVGNIGTLSSALTIGTGDTGIQFNADNNAVMPHNITTGANVDASIDIGYSSGGINRRFKDLYLSGIANIGTYLRFGGASNYYVHSDNANYLRFGTAGTERMRIDSSGNVELKGGQELRVYRGDNATYGSMKYLTGSGGLQLNDKNGDGISFVKADGATEYGRFDASGNLLVGKPSSSFGTDGVEIKNDQIWSTNTSSDCISLNRKTSDGAIATFYKDGSTVGSIGTSPTANFNINSSQSGHVGLEFGSPNIMPMKDGALADNAVDLGVSSQRFRNIYLSGGIQLGGTGSANKLDDYEEGTWTPTLIGSTTAGTGTYTIREGKYVIIGKMIYVSIRLGWSAHTGAGGMRISGLPNTANNNYANLGVVYRDGMTISSGHTVNVGVVPNQTYANILEIATSTDNASLVALDTAVTDISISGWYQIA